MARWAVCWCVCLFGCLCARLCIRFSICLSVCPLGCPVFFKWPCLLRHSVTLVAWVGLVSGNSSAASVGACRILSSSPPVIVSRDNDVSRSSNPSLSGEQMSPAASRCAAISCLRVQFSQVEFVRHDQTDLPVCAGGQLFSEWGVHLKGSFVALFDRSHFRRSRAWLHQWTSMQSH